MNANRLPARRSAASTRPSRSAALTAAQAQTSTVMDMLRSGVRGHPDWCAHDHTCGLGEHRAQPVILDAPGRGRLVITRVRAANGRQHVEVRSRIVLPPGSDMAVRRHVARVLVELDRHLRRVASLPAT